VLPSVEDDFDEDPLIESSSTGVKRKRHTASPHAQEDQSAEDIGPSAWYLTAAHWNSVTFTRESPPDDPRLARLGKSPFHPIFCLLLFIPSSVYSQMIG
jgi:hypothetical protein